MSSGYAYLVLGSGKQGLATAYDLILHGHASRLTLADASHSSAQMACRSLQRLLGPVLKRNRVLLASHRLDVRKREDLIRVLQRHHGVLSALPYYLNPQAAQAAIAAKVHYCDLGGYFDSTRQILRLNAQAKKAGVTLIPDCGVAPGLCNSLAVCGMERLSRARDVHIYCGGLPQKPRPPLDYKIVFNLEGVLGNYLSDAYVLKNGQVVRIPSLSEPELIDLGKPLGKLEARITAGATSTCPWTFRHTVKNYDYKTLRYPGHYERIQFLKDLGLLETAPLRVNGATVAPREMFIAAAGPRLSFPRDRDFLVMKVIVQGKLKGYPMEVVYDLLDNEDCRTGFSAMQRTTGFSAAAVLSLLAQGVIRARGVVPVEKAVPGRVILEAIRQRGIRVTERVRRI